MFIYHEVFRSLFSKSDSITGDMDRKSSRRFSALIITFFFFSGVVGLVYEIVWNRLLTLVFGSTVFATTTVLTAFMSGMAIGSLYFGRLADRSKSPLRIYAYLELGIGVFALLVPLILSAANIIYIALHSNLHSSFYIFSIIRFILCFIILVIPTTLMGGTLPVISKAYTRNKIGWNVGLLYAINTFGAVLGCFLAGFVFIRIIGVSWTIYLSAAINIIIALIILFALTPQSGKTKDYGNDKKEDITETQIFPGWVGKISLWIFAASGFCALAYEVLWTRVLVLFLGSTAYAFATMLSSFLCGIAIGSIILARLADVNKKPLITLGYIQVCIGLAAVALISLLDELYSIGMRFTGTGWGTFIMSKYALSFLIMLIPTMLMGATFPLVTRIYAGSLKEIGRSIGNIYSVNTFGSILGSLTAGFILIPSIGIQSSIIIIAFINAVAGLLAIAASVFHSKYIKSKPSFSNYLLANPFLAIILLSIGIDTGKPITSFTPIFKGAGRDNKLLFYKEEVDTSVTVVEDPAGIRRIFVDTNQAAEDSRWDLPSHSVIGHLPLLIHPNPKNALVIGFGMGVTSWSISRYGVKVDAVEISPGVVESNKFFTKINHNVLSDPLVNLVVDDGRNFALTTPNKYDMISTGIIHPLVSSNSAGFYTRDFYEICKKKLTDNGIMCQWVPLHRIPEEQYKMTIRTFKASFPHTTLWYKYTPDFIILIGTRDELSIDFQDFRQRIGKKGIKEDLELVNMSDPIELLDSFMMDEKAIDQYVGDGPVHTDSRPRMEFFGPQPSSGTTYQNLQGMAKFRMSVLPFLNNVAKTPKEFNEIRDRMQQCFDATQYSVVGQLYYVRGDYDNALKSFLAASTINPDDKNVKWQISYVERQMGITEEALLERIQTNRGDADAHIKLGTVYQNQGLLDKAIAEYKKAIEINPDSMLAHSNLAFIYEGQAKFAEAINELKEVARIRPELPQVHVGIGLLYDKQGMSDDAIASLKKAIQLEPKSPLAMINLGLIYRKKGNIDEAIEQFKNVIKIQPNSAAIHGALGDLYREKGDLTSAESELKQALKIDPSMGSEPNFIITLALVYYEKGMYAEAEKEIKKAISIEPDNQSYRELLTEIQKRKLR